jgi:hypothetical protein
LGGLKLTRFEAVEPSLKPFEAVRILLSIFNEVLHSSRRKRKPPEGGFEGSIEGSLPPFEGSAGRVSGNPAYG